MRLHEEDRTGRAIIRDEALRLFARSGPDAVTIRQIAAAGQVSPALVMRHYGSKDGLRNAVDDHVAATFEAVLEAVSERPGPLAGDADATPGLVEAVLGQLPPGSPIPRYLGRLLIGGGPSAARLFRRLHEAAVEALAALVAGGAAVPGADPGVRAAVLLVNDLGAVILRERIAETIGVDLLSASGMRRWGAEVMAIYQHGLGGAQE